MTNPVREEIDLHGMTREEAARHLGAALRRAFEERRAHLCVIHGRGWRSQGKAVLPRFVREWLVRLEQHPRSPLQRVRFGEEDAALRNPGCVLVDLMLQRADVVFDPGEPAAARRSDDPATIPSETSIEVPEELLEETETELRRWMEEHE